MTDLAELERMLVEMRGPVDGMRAAAIANSYAPWGAESDEWWLFIKALKGSLDAAIALVERTLVMPGYFVMYAYSGMGEWVLRAGVGAHGTEHRVERTDRTPALALCLALVRALIAERGGKAA